MYIDDRQFVVDLYRAILLREPDQEGLSANVEALKAGRTPKELINAFLNSPEYMARLNQPYEAFACDALSALSTAPPMAVELELTAAQERALWAHVAKTWSTLGDSEPYWSVLIDPKWKAGHMTRAETLDAFYDSGSWDIARLNDWLARSKVSQPQTGTCAEFGCGVGRCTVWLARRFARVIAFDVSEPHLRLAKVRAENEGLTNIEFVHVSGNDDLQKLKGIDFFYSIIVLQHNPPPLILSILKGAFDGLREGGIAFFQVPTYAFDYSFKLEDYLTGMIDQGMEMHFVPQRSILELASASGLQPLEVSADPAIGHFGQWISTSFLMAKGKRTWRTFTSARRIWSSVTNGTIFGPTSRSYRALK